MAQVRHGPVCMRLLHCVAVNVTIWTASCPCREQDCSKSPDICSLPGGQSGIAFDPATSQLCTTGIHYTMLSKLPAANAYDWATLCTGTHCFNGELCFLKTAQHGAPIAQHDNATGSQMKSQVKLFNRPHTRDMLKAISEPYAHTWRSKVDAEGRKAMCHV